MTQPTQYTINLNESLALPELGLHFDFKAIAPEGSKYGAWPYCLSYSYQSLDFFGLGWYGSNVRIDDPSQVNDKLNDLIAELSPRSLKAIELNKMSRRQPDLGDKYKVIFTAPGLSHSGTYFESFAELESYLTYVFDGQSHMKDLKAEVYHTTSGIHLGSYVKNNDIIKYVKE
jgi:hypothetical protein